MEKNKTLEYICLAAALLLAFVFVYAVGKNLIWSEKDIKVLPHPLEYEHKVQEVVPDIEVINPDGLDGKG